MKFEGKVHWTDVKLNLSYEQIKELLSVVNQFVDESEFHAEVDAGYASINDANEWVYYVMYLERLLEDIELVKGRFPFLNNNRYSVRLSHDMLHILSVF